MSFSCSKKKKNSKDHESVESAKDLPTFYPTNQRNPSNMPMGLENSRTFSYLNSVLQTLFASAEFRESFINFNEFNDNDETEFAKSIQKLFQNTEDEVCIEKNINILVKKMDENLFGSSIYEVFSQVIMTMDQSMRSVEPEQSANNCAKEDGKLKKLQAQNGGLIFDNFLGIESFKTMCSHCHQVFNADYQILNSLHIEVHEPNLLQEYIKRLQRERVIETYQNHKCCHRSKCVGKSEYIQLPKYLFIFINRHSNDQYKQSLISSYYQFTIRTVTSILKYKVIGLIDTDSSGRNNITKRLINNQWWQTQDGRSSKIDWKNSVTDKSVVYILKLVDCKKYKDRKNDSTTNITNQNKNNTQSIEKTFVLLDRIIEDKEGSPDVGNNPLVSIENKVVTLEKEKEDTTTAETSFQNQLEDGEAEMMIQNSNDSNSNTSLADEVISNLDEEIQIEIKFIERPNELENVYLDYLIKYRIWSVAMIWKICEIDNINISNYNEYFEEFKDNNGIMKFIFDFYVFLSNNSNISDDQLFSYNYCQGIFKMKDWNQSFKIILDIIDKSMSYLIKNKKINNVEPKEMIEENFVGLYQETIKCDTCDFVRQDVNVKRESILLNLPNKSQSDLAKVLRKNMEFFNKCPKCHGNTENFIINVRKAPKYLVLNLNRNSRGQWNSCSFPDQKIISLKINERYRKFQLVVAVDFNKDKMGYKVKYKNGGLWIKSGMDGTSKSCDSDIISGRTMTLIFEKQNSL